MARCWSWSLWGSLLFVLSWQATLMAQTQVYFFTMPGCPPCRQMEPDIDLLIAKGYPVTKIDVSLQREWAERFQIQSTPTTVVVVGNQVFQRQSGVVPAATIAGWVREGDAQGALSNPAAAAPSAVGSSRTVADPSPVGFATVAETGGSRSNSSPNRGGGAYLDRESRSVDDRGAVSNTVHQGTTRPGSRAEQQALQATVRIRVEDAESFSFATGTVIHSHAGEALVLTCGHVFRDSQGKGRITAEFGWLDGEPRRVPAELISYDSEANDVGLIVIHAGVDLPAVPLAGNDFVVSAGDRVFSVGCDLGNNPTIRRTQLKNHALYDGSKKFDIIGRPVVGRSGGGLFTEAGYLIGVCNAAAVNEDEGVYSCFENVHRELERTRLAHLFSSGRAGEAVAGNAPPPSAELLALAQEVSGGQVGVGGDPLGANDRMASAEVSSDAMARVPQVRPVGWERPQSVPSAGLGANMEAVIVIRSKTDPAAVQTIIVDEMSPEMLRVLGLQTPSADKAGATNPGATPTLNDLARLRREMPKLTEDRVGRSPETQRAQSFR